ncbi:MAG TPA: PQQ-binding-like beta-propeller repeat protein [Armatimonadota bacterium]|jgi:outer membrane protein assembly factor BamB
MVRYFQRNARFACVAFLVIAAQVHGANWTQFRGSRAHTGAARDASDGILLPIWTVQLPSIATANGLQPPAVNSSPAIVDGVVYVGSRNTHFYALNAQTGAQVWEYAALDAVQSSPLVKDGVVYFEADRGVLTALNAADGSVVWTHASGGMMDRSSPNISGDNVVCAAAYPKMTIYAVPVGSSGTAPEAWSVNTGQFVYSSPAVDPATQNVYCGSNNGAVYALKPDGSALWAAPFDTVDGSIFWASPTVANGKVYISGGSYDFALHALDAGSGLRVWDAPMAPQPTLPLTSYRAIQVSSPAVDGDFVSVVGGYGDARGPSTLYAFRDKGLTPELLWSTAIPNSVNTDYVSSPAITPASVVVGCAAAADPAHPTWPRGRVYVVDRVTGAAQWYAAGSASVSGGPILSSPAISGDLVVVGDNSGLVTAYKTIRAGDVDGDGTVTVLDCVGLLGTSANGGVPSAYQRYVADVYPGNSVSPDAVRSFGDAKITAGDADRILKYAIGLETRLP